MGQVGAGRTVCIEHVIKPWPWDSDLCWPWRRYQVSRCILVPEHSCPGILLPWDWAWVWSWTSRLRASQRRGHCTQRARVLNLGSSSLGAKQRLGRPRACREGPWGLSDVWGPPNQERVLVRGAWWGVGLREARVLQLIITVAQIRPCQLEAESVWQKGLSGWRDRQDSVSIAWDHAGLKTILTYDWDDGAQQVGGETLLYVGLLYWFLESFLTLTSLYP